MEVFMEANNKWVWALDD